MIYIGPTKFMNDIRHNINKLRSLNLSGIIGIPRSGMIAAALVSEELHIGMCSVHEYLDNNGDDKVFQRHGNRDVRHPNSNIYLILEDTVYNGSFVKHVQELRKSFPDKIFVSACVYLEGPCKIYQPDICLVDIRQEVANDKDLPVALYYYNLLDNYWNNKFLWDLDGVMCVDPPCDIDKDAYESYIQFPIPLHIPITPSKNPISICTYRLMKYERQTRSFLKHHNINYSNLWMFPADTREIRALTPPAQYKGELYKKHDEYVLFIESNDEEAQQICSISHKPVYCYETGRLYKYKQ